MNGIITIYINFHPEHQQDVQANIDIFFKANKAVIDQINSAGDYLVMVVPATKEACRVEKIDFDKPFPRYIPRTHADLEYLDKRRAEKDKDREKERSDRLKSEEE